MIFNCLPLHLVGKWICSVAAATTNDDDQNPSSLAFQYGTKTRGSGIFQAFNTRLGLLRPSSSWTEQLPESQSSSVMSATVKPPNLCCQSNKPFTIHSSVGLLLQRTLTNAMIFTLISRHMIFTLPFQHVYLEFFKSQ